MSDVDAADVLLLRSGDDPDPYVQAFADRGREAACVPVLSFAFPYTDELITHLQRRDRYRALVATSPRVGVALRRAFRQRDGVLTRWKATPAYVVGPKTAKRLRSLGFAVRGEEAGSARALVDVIEESGPEGPLLFLSGNRRRDTLPDGLRAAGIPFEEQVVYETRTRTDICLPVGDKDRWLVFFSPSGLEAIQQSDVGSLAAYRCAAIGPTTADALRSTGLSVEAVAGTPSPEGLVAAIEDVDHS